MAGRPHDIRLGGACLDVLPQSQRCAERARSLLVSTMTALGLPDGLIENGELAVSELATNAHQHAGRGGLADQVAAPELWIWARRFPAPQLVVSVFDADRVGVPRVASAGLLEECGRGLGIVAAVSACWGSHPSRRRLGNWPVPGKATWFALPLPQPWPSTGRIISPADGGDALVAALAARGIAGRCRSDDKGISIVQVGDMNVWVTPNTFSWREGHNRYVQHPLVDLHEVAEQVVRIHEESDPLGRPPLPHAYTRRST